MDTPQPGTPGAAAVTTKVHQRGGAAQKTPAPAETLKHVYSGITLSRDHLATVLGCLRDCCRRVDIHANTFHLTDLDELEAVISEDKIIETLRITATDPHDGEMSLLFQLGYVELEASNPSWKPAFTVIGRLLEGIPKNGTPLCAISLRRRAVGHGPAPAAATPAPAPAVTATALARAAISAAAKAAPVERARTQGGDRQRTIGAGTARVERPLASAPAGPSAGLSTPPTSPVPAPVRSGDAFRIAQRAPLLLHLAGDLALVACVALHWSRIAAIDLPTALLIGLAALCFVGAFVWHLARAMAARNAAATRP